MICAGLQSDRVARLAGDEHEPTIVPFRGEYYRLTPERESLVTVELRAAGSGTELTLRHEELADAEARDKHNQGWIGCLGRLERLMATHDA